MSVAALLGVAAALCLPAGTSPATRALLGWNVGVWTYLVLVGVMMTRADHGHLRRQAVAQAEGTGLVLTMVIAAAVTSLVAIVLEVARVRQGVGVMVWPHLLLAFGTVLGGWLLLPVVFTLSYASLYYARAEERPPLKFPDDTPDFEPHYSDFLYFAITLAVAAQTADVAIARPDMRKLVMVQAVISFAFNTAILALSINIAAGLF